MCNYRAALFTRFGLIINDEPTINVNFFGIAMNILYTCVFFSYTNNVKDRTLAWTQMGYVGGATAAIFAYTYMENPKDLPFRLGIILTVILFYFVGSPLLSLVNVLCHTHHTYIICARNVLIIKLKLKCSLFWSFFFLLLVF